MSLNHKYYLGLWDKTDESMLELPNILLYSKFHSCEKELREMKQHIELNIIFIVVFHFVNTITQNRYKHSSVP